MNGGSAREPRHVVVMGVSGSGKSSVAEAVAERTGWVFAEGDDFHPPANVAKMSRGQALTDDDRRPWLESLGSWTAEQHRRGRSTVMACSALRRSYRDILRAPAPTTDFVLLDGPRALLLERMSGRAHFMPSSLLDSQLATLERFDDDERGVVVSIEGTLDEVVARTLAALGATPEA